MYTMKIEGIIAFLKCCRRRYNIIIYKCTQLRIGCMPRDKVLSNRSYTIDVYIFLLQIWHSLYNWSSESSRSRKAINIFFALLYVVYVLGSAAVVCWVIYAHSLPTFPTIAASVEQVRSNMKCINYRRRLHFIGLLQLRLSMTSYSFIRENTYKVLHPWHKEDESGWCTNSCILIHTVNCTLYTAIAAT